MAKITRRDFINGTLMAAGASMVPFACKEESVLNDLDPDYYPPALTGLRGSQPGSNTHAHARAIQGKADWGATSDTKEEYDLVVVGGGISGLSAAYFYQQKHGSDKKVLILDNHDDFGGHARRNEHTINGDTRIIFGGSQTMLSPHTFGKTVMSLLDDIGVKLDRFDTAYDKDFYSKNNLKAVTYFNKKKFGVDKVVKHPLSYYPYFMQGIERSKMSPVEAVAQTPLSDRGREQLLRVLNGGLHVLDVPRSEMEKYVSTHSYFEYLKSTLGVDDPGVLEIARSSPADNHGAGADILTIAEAFECGVLGFDPLTMNEMIGDEEFEKYKKKYGYMYAEEDEFIHHYPDGNATVARLLVKKMIPRVAEANSDVDIVSSRFKYAELDKSSNIVRIRLNSTAINVEHAGDPQNSGEVLVKYIQDKKQYQVRGGGVVMACYNMMIPYIVPSLPSEQAAAMKRLVKVPLQYSTVGLKDWKAFKEGEIGCAMSPGNMHQVVYMDYPVSMGGYQFTQSPDKPCAIQMVSCPFGKTMGAPPVEQFREARHRMLGLGFRDYEDEIREHLTGMLPAGSFNFDRDVESITVNRWAHGYAHGGLALFDPELKELAIKGRKPFGRITTANIDSATSSYMQVAMEQAYRAVQELG